MNLNKISDLLNVKSEEITKENVSLIISGTSNTSTEIIKYTDNPELIKEIDRYKKEREDSLNALIDARTDIVTILNNGTILNSITNGADWKDIDAFSKLLNTLTGLTQKIDDLSNPQKVEIYIDPKQNETKNDEATNITNIQQNNYLSNPLDLVKIMKGINNGDTTANN